MRLRIPWKTDRSWKDASGLNAAHEWRGASLALRPQYVDVPPSPVIEEPGPGLLLEYFDIVRRHKGTLILIAFLGLLAAFLLTLPQTPIYQARASLEIQNLNEDFLNMREMNPTASGSGSYPPQYDLQTQAKILQSESVLERVIAKLQSRSRSCSRKGPWPPFRLAQCFGSAGVEVGLAPRRGPARGHQEPESQHGAQHAPGRDPLRLQGPAARRRLPQRPDHRIHPAEPRVSLEDLAADRRVAHPSDGRRPHQAGEIRRRVTELTRTPPGLLFTSEKVGTQLIEDNVAEEKLRQLQEELSKAHGERVTKQSKYELVSSAPPESLPEVLDDKTLEDYQVKLTDLRRQLAELSSSLTPAHPSVKKVQAQVTTLEVGPGEGTRQRRAAHPQRI